MTALPEDGSTGTDSPRSGRQSLSLRAQVAILLAIATLPVGILAIAQGMVAYRDIQTLKYRSLAGAAVQASQSERGALREAFGAIEALDSQVDFTAPRGSCNAIFEAYVTSTDTVSFAGAIGRDGRMFCGHPFAADLNLKGTPEFNRFFRKPRRTVTAYRNGAVSGQPVLVASTPAHRGDHDAVEGSIAVSLPSRYLAWVAGNARKHPAARFAIVAPDGFRLEEKNGDPPEDWLPDNEALAALLRITNKPMILQPANGEPRIYSVTPLFENDLFAVASWPEDRLLKSIGWRQLLTVALPIVMWTLALIVAYYAVDRFALRHVLYLDRLVTAYGRSRRKLRARGVREAPREFAQLGESFDRMAEEIESREAALRDTVEEKQTLIKEVYHRVKNNLQLVSSLINLHLREVEADQEREALLRLQDRVHGLSSVHQKLYEAETLNAVRIDRLLRDIALNVKGSRGPDAQEVELRFDMVPMTEGPDRAVPLALFATESIANAFKHALAYGSRGWLSISLRETDTGVALQIENDLPDAVYECDTERVGLGTQLIDGFARQLRATVTRELKADRFSIRLDLPPTPEPVKTGTLPTNA